MSFPFIVDNNGVINSGDFVKTAPFIKNTINTLTSSQPNRQQSLIRLNDNTFVYIFNEGTQDPRMYIGVINNEVITWGQKINLNIVVNGFDAVYTGGFVVKKLNNNQFIVSGIRYLYTGSQFLDYVTAVVGTVSGTTVTFGNNTNVNTAAAHYSGISISTLPNNRIIISYQKTNYEAVFRIGTYTGNTLSWGSETLFNNPGTIIAHAVTSMLTNKIVVAFADSTNNFYGTAITYIANGTSISTTSVKRVFTSSRIFNINFSEPTNLNYSLFRGGVSYHTQSGGIFALVVYGNENHSYFNTNNLNLNINTSYPNTTHIRIDNSLIFYAITKESLGIKLNKIILNKDDAPKVFSDETVFMSFLSDLYDTNYQFTNIDENNLLFLDPKNENNIIKVTYGNFVNKIINSKISGIAKTKGNPGDSIDVYLAN